MFEGNIALTYSSTSLVMLDGAGTQSKSGRASSTRLHLFPMTSCMSPFVGLLRKTPVIISLDSRSCIICWVFTFGREAGAGRGGCTRVVNGRSRMAVDPRIPTMPGRSMSGFHQTGRHCLHQARSTVRSWTSRMKGDVHPSKSRSQDGLRHLVPTFLLMDDGANEFRCVYWCDHSRGSNGYYYVTASWAPYLVHTT